MKLRICATEVVYQIPLLLIFSLTISCEKLPDDLKDTATTGKWSTFNTSTGLTGNQVRGTFCDSKGDMWFAVSSNGAARYSKGTWTYYKTSNSGILSNGVTCVGEDSDGNMLFGTTNGISILETDKTWSYWRHPTLSLVITCIKTDKHDNIWAGTSNHGFFVFDGSQITQVYYEDQKTINDIEEDNKGNIWIGTDGGLLKFDGNRLTLMTQSDGLPDNIITALFSDSKNRLWIGTYFGKTVSWLDSQGIHQQSLFNGSLALQMNDICEDAAGNLWFSTYESGLIRFDGVVPYTFKKYNGIPEDDIIASASDMEGNIWFGLYSKGLLKYTLPLN